VSASPTSRAASTACGGIFDLAGKQARLEEIEGLSSEPGFWDSPDAAQGLLKEKAHMEADVARIQRAHSAVEDAELLLEMAVEEGEDETLSEVAEQLALAGPLVEALEFQRMLSGPDDHRNAILTINSGAGGVDAQDWASMILRMYSRYADLKGWEVEIADLQDGEEAGIKSASLLIAGPNAYGHLKAEAGVHRLVRISPFDAAARRHTAFSSVYVSPEVDDDIDIEVRDDEVRVDVFRASGAGGQKVNKTSSAVRLTHLPTGIIVSCQNERSQHKNRDLAWKVLKSRLYDLELKKREAEAAKVEATKSDISFGSQIRSYVMAPYQMVKDHRTEHESGNPQRILDGELDAFIQAFLMRGAEGPAEG